MSVYLVKAREEHMQGISMVKQFLVMLWSRC